MVIYCTYNRLLKIFTIKYIERNKTSDKESVPIVFGIQDNVLIGGELVMNFI